jgi:hypothetical protein
MKVRLIDDVGMTSHGFVNGGVYEVVKEDINYYFFDEKDVSSGWCKTRFEPANPIFDVPAKDMVDQPHHYARWKMQAIEFIAINNLPWWIANVIKYIMRNDAKDGLKDLYKARSYLDMKIRELEGVQDFWNKPVSEERRLNALPR